MESTIIVELFKRAHKKRNNPENLIFHSDQGGQYKSQVFKKTLNEHNVTQSFSKTRCPYDNAEGYPRPHFFMHCYKWLNRAILSST